MQNNIKLLTISELAQFDFYIPSYQRGYRWTNLEVEDLLNDIDEFVPKEVNGTDEKTWYCLQPIVIKGRSDKSYEVIDGQQRLTTIYLIWYYLNQDFVEARRDKLFTLDYSTREKSKLFLNNPEKKDESNIDFFFMHNAYETIEKWFGSKDDLKFDTNAFRSKFKFYTKVIWYEIYENDTIKVFTRLNIGKISLTNAELIKALFLNSSNFHSNNKERMRLRQIEIANEWDSIESALQNNKFWYFLSDKNITDNRIEYIFNLMSNPTEKDAYATFRYFSSRLNGKTEVEMNECWEEIQAYYQRFSEWFNDRTLYHKIGFILNTEIISISELYRQSSSVKKSDFLDFLDTKISDYYKNQNLFDFDYENSKTKSILLLYNILTMLKNDHDSSYFPFDSFKLNRWNVEHIASRKDPGSIPLNNRKDWLEDVKCYIDDSQKDASDLTYRINTCIMNMSYADDDTFNSLFEDVTNHFNKYINQDDDMNSISNLALLDEKTNKGYKNAVFPLKRKTIIELDKSGGFVPLCTKNVFLKYFSDYPPKISFWTQDDREKYENDLKNVLSGYLEVEN